MLPEFFQDPNLKDVLLTNLTQGKYGGNEDIGLTAGIDLPGGAVRVPASRLNLSLTVLAEALLRGAMAHCNVEPPRLVLEPVFAGKEIEPLPPGFVVGQPIPNFPFDPNAQVGDTPVVDPNEESGKQPADAGIENPAPPADPVVPPAAPEVTPPGQGLILTRLPRKKSPVLKARYLLPLSMTTPTR